MPKSDAFDNHAIEYDKWFESHPIEYAQELKTIKELLPENGIGVEIGAGTGRFTQSLGISLGIEPSENMRNIASSRGVNIIDGTAESLPINDDMYDYALLVTTVCFLDSLELAFIEAHRILKENAYIIIGLIDKHSSLGKKYEQKKKNSNFYKDATFHSVEEIRRALKNTGFNNFEYCQAILPGDTDDCSGAKIKSGYGEGSFVVLRAQKNVTSLK